MVNSPKPAQAASSAANLDHCGGSPCVCAPVSVSIIRPSNTGSANCAEASATFASANTHANTLSGPSSARTRP